MPSMRRAALTWNPRDNGPVMVSLVQKWMPILPNWVLENLLEQVFCLNIFKICKIFLIGFGS